MIFTNARLIFPDGIRDGLEVVVEEGKIAAIQPPTPRLRRTGERVRGNEIIDLNGNYLAPGFIDLHVHGALGRDTMEASAEAFRSICDFHASGGTTSLLLTTATAPLDEIVKVLQAVRDFRPAIRRDCRCSCRRTVHFESESRSATRRIHSGPVTGCCAAVA